MVLLALVIAVRVMDGGAVAGGAATVMVARVEKVRRGAEEGGQTPSSAPL